jgi:RHH-type proline utilization regulon transcriptional repressor/proline dehydrogenase/delta 1-pyrroline-5-carboxylate dehydrogenase
VDLLGEATVTQAEAQRYADRCADALDTIAVAAAAGRRASSSSATPPGRSRARTCREGAPRLTPLLRPDAPERGKRDRRRPAAALLRRAHERARTCTSTWSRWTRATPS